jgi:hypothetical protein
MGFKVLLITHYLIREILVETVLDVHARGVKIKKRFIDPNAVTIHPLKKKDHREIHMLICTQRTICSLRHHGRIDGWVNF